MTCPVCAAPTEEGWSFCRKCGITLPAAQTAAVSAAGIAEPVPAADGAAAVNGHAGNHASAAGSGHAPANGRGVMPAAVTSTAPRVPLPATAPEVTAPPAEGTGALSAHATLTDLMAPGTIHESPAVPATPNRGERRRWQLWALSAALVVAVVAGTVTGWQLHTRGNQLHDTRATLAATQSTLDTRNGELAAAKAEIADQTSQISDLTTKNTTLTSQLNDAQTQLQGTKNTIGRQTKEIGYLNTCLRGVSTALGYVAYGDYTDAIAQLNAVQVTCRKAQAGL